MHVGENIAFIRKRKNIKQEDLAHRFGISQQALSKIENSYEVSDKTLKSVADELGVDADLLRHFDIDRYTNHILGEHNIVINYVVNYTINGLKPAESEQLLGCLRDIITQLQTKR